MKRIDLQRIKKHGVDFFVTGNGYIRDCLNLKFIPCVHEEETANRGG